MFSSSEEYKIDSYVLSRLESIREKSIHEMSENDLEEGIGMSLINRRFSTGDLLQRQPSSSEAEDKPAVAATEKIQLSNDSSISSSKNEKLRKKRHVFSRMKSLSYDEDAMLSKIVHEQLAKTTNNNTKTSPTIKQPIKTPVIVRTEHTSDDEDSSQPASDSHKVIPKQVEGLLQVSE